jgi:dTDP-4-dehydrorhamnose reductase
MEKKLKILVLGSRGMLGHLVVKYFDQNVNYEVFSISRSSENRPNHYKLDLTDFKELKTIIDNLQPNFIINCAGILVKNSNDSVKNAILINSYLPHFISEIIDDTCKFIHVSTDCVFDGKIGSYKENDDVSPIDTYGRTKSLGEINNNNNVLTIRTSIIGLEISNHKTGLLEWFINENGTINGYVNDFWSGVTTLELVKIIDYCMSVKWYSGVKHLAMKDKISKYDLLVLIDNILNLNKKIVPFNSKFHDRSLKMDNLDFSNILNFNYKSMLLEYFEFNQ